MSFRKNLVVYLEIAIQHCDSHAGELTFDDDYERGYVKGKKDAYQQLQADMKFVL